MRWIAPVKRDLTGTLAGPRSSGKEGERRVWGEELAMITFLLWTYIALSTSVGAAILLCGLYIRRQWGEESPSRSAVRRAELAHREVGETRGLG